MSLIGFADIRRDPPFRRRLDNNGQTSIMARDGYDLNDSI
jgi:hypothetical protein